MSTEINKKVEIENFSHMFSLAKFTMILGRIIVGTAKMKIQLFVKGFDFSKLVKPYCCLAPTLTLESFNILDVNLCILTNVPIAIMLNEDSL